MSGAGFGSKGIYALRQGTTTGDATVTVFGTNITTKHYAEGCRVGSGPNPDRRTNGACCRAATGDFVIELPCMVTASTSGPRQRQRDLRAPATPYGTRP